jgi:hypothetical protein
MKYSDLPTLERPAADLALVTGANAPAPRRRAAMSRRQALGSVGVLGMIAYTGAKVLGPLGRARAIAGPVNPGNSSCDVGSLTYWSNGNTGPCGGGYAEDDDCNGCNGPHRSTDYCRHRWDPVRQQYVVDFNARHVGCGETVPGISGKQYKFRTNVCHAGSYDGWQWWTGANTCGCSGGRTRKYACNDGWVSTNGFATCYPSICRTQSCVQQ